MLRSRQDQNSGGQTIMKPTVKKAKLSTKKLEKKVPLTVIRPH